MRLAILIILLWWCMMSNLFHCRRCGYKCKVKKDQMGYHTIVCLNKKCKDVHAWTHISPVGAG